MLERAGRRAPQSPGVACRPVHRARGERPLPGRRSSSWASAAWSRSLDARRAPLRLRRARAHQDPLAAPRLQRQPLLRVGLQDAQVPAGLPRALRAGPASVGAGITLRAAAVAPSPRAVRVAPERHRAAPLVAAVFAARRGRRCARAGREREWIGRDGTGPPVRRGGGAARRSTGEGARVVVGGNRRRVAMRRVGIAGCLVLAAAPQRDRDHRGRRPSLQVTLPAPHRGPRSATPVPESVGSSSEIFQADRVAERLAEREGARGRTAGSWRGASWRKVARPVSPQADVHLLAEARLSVEYVDLALERGGATRSAHGRETRHGQNGTGLVVGRKNHYGSKSRRGTEVAATFYTLIETAKLTGVDPTRYLRAAALADACGELLLPADIPR
jgi:hypothetical protein